MSVEWTRIYESARRPAQRCARCLAERRVAYRTAFVLRGVNSAWQPPPLLRTWWQETRTEGALSWVRSYCDEHADAARS